MNALTPWQRAALRLASLGHRDRNWVMDRLSDAERNRVKPLLATLPRCTPEALAAVMHDLEAAEADAIGAHDASTVPQRGPMRLMDHARAQDWEPVLDELPTGCASLLAERLPPDRRHLLRAASGDAGTESASGSVTPAFVDLLMDVVEARLGASSPAFEAILMADASAQPMAGVAK